MVNWVKKDHPKPTETPSKRPASFATSVQDAINRQVNESGGTGMVSHVCLFAVEKFSKEAENLLHSGAKFVDNEGEKKLGPPIKHMSALSRDCAAGLLAGLVAWFRNKEAATTEKRLLGDLFGLAILGLMDTGLFLPHAPDVSSLTTDIRLIALNSILVSYGEGADKKGSAAGDLMPMSRVVARMAAMDFQRTMEAVRMQLDSRLESDRRGHAKDAQALVQSLHNLVVPMNTSAEEEVFTRFLEDLSKMIGRAHLREVKQELGALARSLLACNAVVPRDAEHGGDSRRGQSIQYAVRNLYTRAEEDLSSRCPGHGHALMAACAAVMSHQEFLERKPELFRRLFRDIRDDRSKEVVSMALQSLSLIVRGQYRSEERRSGVRAEVGFNDVAREIVNQIIWTVPAAAGGPAERRGPSGACLDDAVALLCELADLDVDIVMNEVVISVLRDAAAEQTIGISPGHHYGYQEVHVDKDKEDQSSPARVKMFSDLTVVAVRTLCEVTRRFKAQSDKFSRGLSSRPRSHIVPMEISRHTSTITGLLGTVLRSCEKSLDSMILTVGNERNSMTDEQLADIGTKESVATNILLAGLQCVHWFEPANTENGFSTEALLNVICRCCMHICTSISDRAIELLKYLPASRPDRVGSALVAITQFLATIPDDARHSRVVQFFESMEKMLLGWSEYEIRLGRSQFNPLRGLEAAMLPWLCSGFIPLRRAVMGCYQAITHLVASTVNHDGSPMKVASEEAIVRSQKREAQITVPADSVGHLMDILSRDLVVKTATVYSWQKPSCFTSYADETQEERGLADPPESGNAGTAGGPRATVSVTLEELCAAEDPDKQLWWSRALGELMKALSAHKTFKEVVAVGMSELHRRLKKTSSLVRPDYRRGADKHAPPSDAAIVLYHYWLNLAMACCCSLSKTLNKDPTSLFPLSAHDLLDTVISSGLKHDWDIVRLGACEALGAVAGSGVEVLLDLLAGLEDDSRTEVELAQQAVQAGKVVARKEKRFLCPLLVYVYRLLTDRSRDPASALPNKTKVYQKSTVMIEDGYKFFNVMGMEEQNMRLSVFGSSHDVEFMRFNYSQLVENHATSVYRDVGKDHFHPSVRHRVFLQLRQWIGQENSSGSHSPSGPNQAFLALQPVPLHLAAMSSMSALLAGPYFTDEAVVKKGSGIVISWLSQMFKMQSTGRIRQISWVALSNLLRDNKNLLLMCLDKCYDHDSRVAQGFFEVFVGFVIHEDARVPEPLLLHACLYKATDRCSTVRGTAIRLLRYLWPRLHTPKIKKEILETKMQWVCYRPNKLQKSKRKGGEAGSVDMNEAMPNALFVSQETFSRVLATVFPQWTCALIGETDRRLKLIHPEKKAHALNYLLPWTKNISFCTAKPNDTEQKKRLIHDIGESVMNTLLRMSASMIEVNGSQIGEIWRAIAGSGKHNNIKFVIDFLILKTQYIQREKPHALANHISLMRRVVGFFAMEDDEKTISHLAKLLVIGSVSRQEEKENIDEEYEKIRTKPKLTSGGRIKTRFDMKKLKQVAERERAIGKIGVDSKEKQREERKSGFLSGLVKGIGGGIFGGGDKGDKAPSKRAKPSVFGNLVNNMIGPSNIKIGDDDTTSMDKEPLRKTHIAMIMISELPIEKPELFSAYPVPMLHLAVLYCDHPNPTVSTHAKLLLSALLQASVLGNVSGVKADKDVRARALEVISYLQASERRPLWQRQHLTLGLRRRDMNSVHEVGGLVSSVIACVPKSRQMRLRWQSHALRWAEETSVESLAGRSLHIFSALDPQVDPEYLSRILGRISAIIENVISDTSATKGALPAAMQSALLECYETLDEMIDSSPERGEARALPFLFAAMMALFKSHDPVVVEGAAMVTNRIVSMMDMRRMEVQNSLLARIPRTWTWFEGILPLLINALSASEIGARLCCEIMIDICSADVKPELCDRDTVMCQIKMVIALLPAMCEYLECESRDTHHLGERLPQGLARALEKSGNNRLARVLERCCETERDHIGSSSVLLTDFVEIFAELYLPTNVNTVLDILLPLVERGPRSLGHHALMVLAAMLTAIKAKKERISNDEGSRLMDCMKKAEAHDPSLVGSVLGLVVHLAPSASADAVLPARVSNTLANEEAIQALNQVIEVIDISLGDGRPRSVRATTGTSSTSPRGMRDVSNSLNVPDASLEKRSTNRYRKQAPESLHIPGGGAAATPVPTGSPHSSYIGTTPSIWNQSVPNSASTIPQDVMNHYMSRGTTPASTPGWGTPAAGGYMTPSMNAGGYQASKDNSGYATPAGMSIDEDAVYPHMQITPKELERAVEYKRMASSARI